jgi:diguanylate cyclase (GGDEF)-like protein
MLYERGTFIHIVSNLKNISNMNLRNRQSVLLALLVIFISFAVFSNNAGEDDLPNGKNTITELLKNTESLRISDNKLFVENLAKLNKLQKRSKLSPYQNCYFDYLTAYELGYKGHYDLAKQKLIYIFDSCIDNENKIRSKLLLANLQVISQDYVSAINNLDYTISNIGLVKDNLLKLHVYSVASTVYRLVDQNSLSLEFAELMISNNPTPTYLCDGLVAKYRILLKSTELAQIESQIVSTLDTCERQGNFVLSNFLRLEWLDKYLGNTTDEQLKHKILDQLKLAEVKINRAKYQNLISIKDSVYAKIYWALNDYPKAIDHAKRSLDGSKAIGSTKQKIVSLKILVDYFRMKNDPEMAIKYLIMKNESEKLQYDDQLAKTMAYQTVRHENLAKTHKINILNQKNVLLSLEKDISDKTAFIQKLTILLLMILTIFFVSWGIKHKKIQKMYKNLAERDYMTLIYNRKGLREYVGPILDKAEKNEKEIGFAIFDLDLFKNINDEFGHITGDWVIKTVIKTCQKISDKAILGRLGGEEFAILLPDTDLQGTLEFCEKCRIKISQLHTIETGFDFTISASFGITSTQVSGYNYTSMLIHADEALYKAKNLGRNRSVVYQSKSA